MYKKSLFILQETQNLLVELIKSMFGLSKFSFAILIFFCLLETNAFIPRKKYNYYSKQTKDLLQKFKVSIWLILKCLVLLKTLLQYAENLQQLHSIWCLLVHLCYAVILLIMKWMFQSCYAVTVTWSRIAIFSFTINITREKLNGLLI